MNPGAAAPAPACLPPKSAARSAPLRQHRHHQPPGAAALASGLSRASRGQRTPASLWGQGPPPPRRGPAAAAVWVGGGGGERTGDARVRPRDAQSSVAGARSTFFLSVCYNLVTLLKNEYTFSFYLMCSFVGIIATLGVPDVSNKDFLGHAGQGLFDHC